MFHIVLYQPEIPPNTGNIIRLCANAGMALHLIEPMGFALDEKKVRRAGLDYRDMTNVTIHSDLENCLEQIKPNKVYACTTKGSSCYADAAYVPGDALLFGPETRGLPEDLIFSMPEEQRIKIPMQPGSRSLNLSNAVAIISHEAWRQNGFALTR